MIRQLKIGFILALIFLSVGVLTLSDYGVNADEHIHFARGQASLRYLLTGKKDYSGLPPEFPRRISPSQKIEYPKEWRYQRSIYQQDNLDMNWFLGKNTWGHPGTNDLLAALSNVVFFQKLRILDDVEAYHLFSLTTSACLVFLIFLFAQEVYGGIAGLIAALALGTYPLFLGESRFNVKDPPETFFYAAAILMFWKGVKEKKAKYFFLFAFFFSLGFGTKFNILFALITLFGWLLIVFGRDILKSGLGCVKKIPPSILLSLFLFPLIVVLIFLATNPFLWDSPFENFLSIINYYRQIGGLGGARSVQPGFLWRNFNFYPIMTVFYTTPLVTLFFSIIGFCLAIFRWRKEKEKTSFLVLAWFAVTILRVTLPPFSIYGGLRQIMEYIPAMAILAGLGAESLRQFLSKKIASLRLLWGFFFILTFIPIVIKMIAIHPFQNVYFNPLIGGLKGATERNYPYAGLDMGNVYLQGINWMNKNAETDAKLAIAIGSSTNLPWNKLREDISYTNLYLSFLSHQGEYVIDTFYQDKIQRYSSWFCRRYLEPVHEVKVEGVPLLKIWKNDLEHVGPHLVKTEIIKPKLYWGEAGKRAIFDFGKPVILERFDLFPEGFCKDELEKLAENKSERISYSGDGQNWQIEFDDNAWDATHDWIVKYFMKLEGNTEAIDKGFVFFFAARKARYLKAEFSQNCQLELKDWRARVYSDFINLPLSFNKNQLTASANIKEAGEYLLISSRGALGPKITISNKQYYLWFDTPFVEEPLFSPKEGFLKLIDSVFLNKGVFSFQIPIRLEKNLLRNPSFEEGLSSWSGGEIVNDGTEGNKALRLEAKGEGINFSYQKNIPEFRKDSLYLVSFDYKLLKGEAAVGAWQPPYPDYPQRPEALTGISNQWQHQTIFINPANNTIGLDIYLYAISHDSKGAEVLFDNIHVWKIPKNSLPSELWLIKKAS